MREVTMARIVEVALKDEVGCYTYGVFYWIVNVQTRA